MGPLPYGPPTKHVLASRGPDYNNTQFYVTEYSLNHGKEAFLPKLGKHTGTGYQNNFRPGVYYSRKIDELDNPTVGNLITENYNSCNKVHFQQYEGSDGKDTFANNIHMVKTGFIRDVPQTLPPYQKVKSACYNPSYNKNSKVSKPFLYHINNSHKDPIEQENDFYGPGLMSTENRTRFTGAVNQRMDTSTKSVGPKEGSGFTHAYNTEPITYRPTECFDVFHPAKFRQRPTGASVMKVSFQPSDGPDGKESFKILSKRAVRDTGYTRQNTAKPAYSAPLTETYTRLHDVHPLKRGEIKKNDPAEYFNMVHAKPYPSTTTATFRGLQNITNDNTQNVGKKEETGFTENNCKLIETSESPNSLQRFNTNYKLRFYDKNPKSLDRRINVMNHLSNGFTKSTKFHSQKAIRDVNLKELHPYVARSITSRDPYYVIQGGKS